MKGNHSAISAPKAILKTSENQKRFEYRIKSTLNFSIGCQGLAMHWQYERKLCDLIWNRFDHYFSSM